MVCQECKLCCKEVYEDYICLYVDRDCYDGCDFCLDKDECKYEGGLIEDVC